MYENGTLSKKQPFFTPFSKSEHKQLDQKDVFTAKKSGFGGLCTYVFTSLVRGPFYIVIFLVACDSLFPLLIELKQNSYHLQVGRSVDETLRLVQAFQYTDKHGEVCPAGWKPGKDTIIPDPKEKVKYFQKHENENGAETNKEK